MSVCGRFQRRSHQDTAWINIHGYLAEVLVVLKIFSLFPFQLGHNISANSIDWTPTKSCILNNDSGAVLRLEGKIFEVCSSKQQRNWPNSKKMTIKQMKTCEIK